MKNLLPVCAFLFLFHTSFSQTTQIKAEKYPSLLWEISGNGLRKPSYLFGTMHVSSKMVFHLSDSFYLGIRNAQVVALETNPGTWQEDFSRYDLDGESASVNQAGFENDAGFRDLSAPQDFLTVNSLKLSPFEKAMEVALYSNPSLLNNFLYRTNSEAGADFEEDTYLDLHIFQAGRKLGKKICGVEDFHGSMQLVKEAYADAAREKKKKGGTDYDNGLSYGRLEEAYRTGNLDLLDTINKVNSQSAAFDEKFLYKRNDIQAASIDSILKTGATLFAGVGAAHLPGERGVIEILRRQGYRLRPIKMLERDSHHKDNIEKIRVPVQFARQTAEDGFYSVMTPGRLYSAGRAFGGLEMRQYADMTNGSYYMVSRLTTNAAIQGQTDLQVQRKLDSVLYENIPGRILQKKAIVRNGYRGYDISNRTRRGDYQRYNIFVTPFELLIFKMSGNADYVRLGTEAEQFFSSIQLKEQKTDWKKWSPAFGGFEVELPHPPLVQKEENWLFAAWDAGSKTAFNVIRTDIHNHDFLEEDAFDLALMEESFASSDCIARTVTKQAVNVNGYPAMDVWYRYKDSSVAVVRFLVKGPHYYTLVAAAKEENGWMARFIRSFRVSPFVYGQEREQVDTVLKFRVKAPVALEKTTRLPMYPGDWYSAGYRENADDSLVDNGTYRSRIVENDSTGEKIHVSFYKYSPYFFRNGKEHTIDSAAFYKEWSMRRRGKDSLSNGLLVEDYELWNRQSSRKLRIKTFLKDGMGYTLSTALDTLAEESPFISRFYQSFEPLESLRDVDVNSKKTALFFRQFFSADSVQRRKAIKNSGAVLMDAADLPLLKKAIESLTWKEKAYLRVKKELFGKLADMPVKEAADYLKDLYYRAGDTAELQYAALETLLSQRTASAYQTFAGILETDPPVLDLSGTGRDYITTTYRQGGRGGAGRYTTITQNGWFFDNLADSLQLTAAIFPRLLPLITVTDYEQPVMQLLGTLVDSGLVRPADYEAYLPKLVLEAKQTLKKQLIREKAKEIEKAKKDEEENTGLYDHYRDKGDGGNNRLSLYATLLLPFWDKNGQVQPLFNQLLQSTDQRLRYTTLLLLLRNNRPVPDSLLQAFAANDEFRYELLTDLRKLNRQDLFPLRYRNGTLIARSRLVSGSSYRTPDTLAFVQTLPVSVSGTHGRVFVFKYKEKKEDNGWKIATAGLFPTDSTALFFENTTLTEDELDFTELTESRLEADRMPEQLEKLRKKLVYGRRKSGLRFYEDNDRYDADDYLYVR